MKKCPFLFIQPIAVHLAANGVEAVETTRLEHVDLVLLDMSMLGASINETHAALRAVLPTVPILPTSGYNDSSVLRGLLEQHVTVFIHKPCSIAELLERCERMLG